MAHGADWKKGTGAWMGGGLEFGISEQSSMGPGRPGRRLGPPMAAGHADVLREFIMERVNGMFEPNANCVCFLKRGALMMSSTGHGQSGGQA